MNYELSVSCVYIAFLKKRNDLGGIIEVNRNVTKGNTLYKRRRFLIIMMKDKIRHCIFCGRRAEEVSYFILSKKEKIGICSSCVKLCDKLVQELEEVQPLTEGTVENKQNISSITDFRLKRKRR